MRLILLMLFIASSPVFADTAEGIYKSDDGLTVKVEQLEGVQERTSDKYYTKITLERDEESFFLWCNTTFVQSSLRQSIPCGKFIPTISGDDDENLSFTITRKTSLYGEVKYSIDQIEYLGDYTFLEKEALILQGDRDWMPDQIELKGSPYMAIERDPFLYAIKVNESMSKISDVYAYIEELGQSMYVVDHSFRLINGVNMKLKLSFSEDIDLTGFVDDLISVLAMSGDIGSGIISKQKMFDRVDEACL